uniref:Uncharacterized protein n=1 Tax=Opuntia streptacantha TaxID=393608 RepID=A0A7C9ARY1_OPUST
MKKSMLRFPHQGHRRMNLRISPCLLLVEALMKITRKRVSRWRKKKIWCKKLSQQVILILRRNLIQRRLQKVPVFQSLNRRSAQAKRCLLQQKRMIVSLLLMIHQRLNMKTHPRWMQNLQSSLERRLKLVVANVKIRRKKDK